MDKLTMCEFIESMRASALSISHSVRRGDGSFDEWTFKAYTDACALESNLELLKEELNCYELPISRVHRRSK